MKIKCSVLAASLLCAFALNIGLPCYGQVPLGTNNVAIKSAIISFAQGVDTAKELTVAVYPSYAPGIAKGQGQFGGGIAGLYPIAPQTLDGHAYTGLRLDFIGNSWSAATIGVGLKADVQIFSHNFTPFTTASALIPFNGNGSGDVGALLGGGVATTFWHSANGKAVFGAFVQVEYSTQFKTEIYHGGPFFNLKF